MENYFVPKVVTLLFFLLTLSRISPTSAYGSGAPPAACNDLTPQHGVPPQTSPSPYKVILGKTPLSVNTPLSITLTSKNDRDEFIGFLVQVRKVDGKATADGKASKPVLDGGKFDNSQSKDSKILECSGKPVAMTHKGNEPKRKVTVSWVPDTPGAYRVHATFVKTGDTFWVNQVDDQIVEVHTTEGHNDHQQHPSSSLDMCSTMKINASVEPQVFTSSPYTIMVKPVVNDDGNGDTHKISQKGKMWINVSSEYDTPIFKMFMQVRPQQENSKLGNTEAVGKFIAAITTPKRDQGIKVTLVDCFGGKANAILFENQLHTVDKKISDVSVTWEAPQDQVGDFQAVMTILSEGDTFWDKVGDDPEATKIKVVKSSSNGQPSSPGKSASSSIFSGAMRLFLFFSLSFVLAP